MSLFRVVSTVALYRKGPRGFEFLITRRAKNLPFMPGRWTIPGGGLEATDFNGAKCEYHIVETGAHRELSEEIGPVEYGAFTYLCTFCFKRHDGGLVVGISYYAPWVAGIPQLDKDSDAFMWVTAADAKSFDLIEDIHGELERIEKILLG